MMSAVATQSFLFVVIAHAMSIFMLSTIGALSIAGEVDKKTLGFLLATRLGNTEIVLGKLAACLIGFLSSLAAGLPVMILLNVLGGVHPQLILLAYAGILSTAFFILSLALWVSSGAPDGRRATNIAVLTVLAWLIAPILLGMTPLLSRIGIRPPDLLVTINAWILSSNPVSLLPRFIGGVNPRALSSAVSWMCGLQLAAGAVFVAAAIFRLRRAYRTNVGGDGHGLMRRLALPAWRFRPRPPVGDDPIFWRERYTSRSGLIGQLMGFCIVAAIYCTLVYFTFFFAQRAFVELWHHGYTAATASAQKPELNLILRYFIEQSGPGVPIDAARTDFNIFLRFVTCAILFMIALAATGIALEVLGGERTKETWTSLIATPLSGRDILLGKFRACLWRLRNSGDRPGALDARTPLGRASSAGFPRRCAHLGLLDHPVPGLRPPGRIDIRRSKRRPWSNRDSDARAHDLGRPSIPAAGALQLGLVGRGLDPAARRALARRLWRVASLAPAPGRPLPGCGVARPSQR